MDFIITFYGLVWLILIFDILHLNLFIDVWNLNPVI